MDIQEKQDKLLKAEALEDIEFDLSMTLKGLEEASRNLYWCEEEEMSYDASSFCSQAKDFVDEARIDIEKVLKLIFE